VFFIDLTALNFLYSLCKFFFTQNILKGEKIMERWVLWVFAIFSVAFIVTVAIVIPRMMHVAFNGR